MKKLFAVIAGLVLANSANAFTMGQLSGMWYNPSTSGQGFIIQSANEGTYMLFFTFENPVIPPLAPNVGQAWLTTSLVASTAVDPTLTLYRASAGALNSGVAHARAVGQVAVIATSCEQVTFIVDISDTNMGCSETPGFSPNACSFITSTTRLTHASPCS